MGRSPSKLPPMAMSLQSTSMNKTGTWRYMRPVPAEGIPPCNEACLASQNIEGIILHITNGKFNEAYAEILKENPLPSVTGRVCSHPCEEWCNRGQYDESVSIQALERFVGDYGLRSRKPLPQLRSIQKEEIAVVGSGPAGLSCSYHLARIGYKVTIVEAMPVLGGKLRWAIPGYRLPKTILDEEIENILSLGIRVIKNVQVGRNIRFEDLKRYKDIFVATGAQNSLPLDLPGEDSKGVVPALEFLRTLNLGMKVILGSKPVVIGGGNTAIDVARSCLRLGSQPLIIYRRSREDMPAFKDEVEDAEREGIYIQHLVSPLRIVRQRGRLMGLECLKVYLGKPDSSGRRTPIPIKGSNFIIETDQVIKAIGERTDIRFLPKRIRTDGDNIVTNPYLMTSQPGIFAGGDVIPQPRSVGHAILSGKKAAISIDCYLKGKDVKEVYRSIQVGGKNGVFIEAYLNPTKCNLGGKQVIGFEEINKAYFEQSTRLKDKFVITQKAIQGFLEVRLGLDRSSAAQSAQRCFQCGLCNLCRNGNVFCPDLAVLLRRKGLKIDYDHCKGCGICVKECPRGALVMTEEA